MIHRANALRLLQHFIFMHMVKHLIAFLTASFIAYTAFLGIRLHKVVHTRKAMMEDYAEINKANYELFNIQLWKEQAMDIIEKRIMEYNISPTTYDFLDEEIQRYLGVMHKRYFEEGELSDVILTELKRSGKVNALIMKMVETQVPGLVKNLDLRPEIPGFSDQIVQQIKANEPQIMEYIHAEMLRLVLDSSEDAYQDRREYIFERYDQPDADTTDEFLIGEIEKLDLEIGWQIKMMIIFTLLSIILCFLANRFWEFKWMISGLTIISIILLILGVSMPMIDIDARLSSFSFSLLGEPIEFNEQIIYYQSKSIVEVTKTLWRGGTWDLRLVGILVIMFSIIFPTVKLGLSGLYLFTDKIKKSSVAKAIIFHLGKWSMADVFVVAIFMAYIGFYGIISSQLQGLSQNQGGFAIDTVNYSRLSPGAFFFTSYVVLSILISIMIYRTGGRETEA